MVGDTLYTKPLLSTAPNGDETGGAASTSILCAAIGLGTAAIPSSPVDPEKKLGCTQSDMRLLLHSETIAFSHPATGLGCSVRAPCPF